MINETIGYLGLRGKDRVTGFTGTVTSVCFDLYGCVQLILTPDAGKPDKQAENGGWYDVNRVEILDNEPRRLPVPQSFRDPNESPATYEKGPAEKSLPNER